MDLTENQSPVGQIDGEILELLVQIGYNRSSIQDSLKYNYFDEIMGMYLMLKDIKDGNVFVNINQNIKTISNVLDRWIKLQYLLK